MNLASAPEPAAWRAHAERGSPGLLRLMTCLSLRLGRNLSRVPLYAITTYFFLFAPRARRHTLQYLRRALGREPHALDRFRLLLYFATVIHDRLFLVNGRYGAFDISVEGEELMRSRQDSGGGAFLLGAHFGSFEVMRSFGQRQASMRIAMAMYEENARKINSILRAIDPAVSPDIIALGRVEAMLKIAERLDQGGYVGMLGDRTLGDEPAQRVMLLGRPAYLPIGPLRAAAILRRPVIFMVGIYRGANRYHVVFAPLADFTATPATERDAAVHAAVERYAALLERYCISDPYNWFNFFDIWRTPPDA